MTVVERSTSSLPIALRERFQYLSSMLGSLTTDYSSGRSPLMRLAAYRRLRECVGHGIAWHLMIFLMHSSRRACVSRNIWVDMSVGDIAWLFDGELTATAD
jgi:hypothetical protein